MKNIENSVTDVKLEGLKKWVSLFKDVIDIYGNVSQKEDCILIQDIRTDDRIEDGFVSLFMTGEPLTELSKFLEIEEKYLDYSFNDANSFTDATRSFDLKIYIE
jgi:hypothetical protein